jgi:uncharacterized protein (DUF1501 family)
MRMLTRRALMKSGACALVIYAGAPRFLLRAAAAAAPSGKVLVAVFQRGAVDGLSMIPPHGDPGYYAARNGIALQRPRPGDSERAIDLDGFFALHPALAPLKPAWDGGALAIVHACGSPDVTRSHFDAQDYMESGTPGVRSTPDGWLARTLAARGVSPSPPSPVRAVAFGAMLPRSLRGGAGALAMPSIGDFDLTPGMRGGGAARGFEALYETGAGDLLHGAGRETFEAAKMLRSAGASGIAPANGAQYPRTRLGESLRQVAQLIRAGVGLEIAFADTGGWDTHAGQGNERGQLASRLREFAAALAAFHRDLGDRMADVVVLSMSEFGRTVQENGNRGTDHGHATAMLVLGGAVRGGKVYGRWPGLAREQLFEGRDLAVTTDFRALFAEVAARHLSLPDAVGLFPGYPAEGRTALGLL